jgi:FKBP-type peptidyl-prolyl cis-trans isomerase 2
MIKKKDFIEIEYTGKLKEDGAVFDTTDEKTAKENHLYREDAEYGPITVCVGEKHILKGIEDFIVGKDIGDYTIDVKPEDAFGKKNAKLIQMIPARKFTEHNIKPMPGLSVNVDGMVGIIKSASGGRILVDFNHPLSGKELVYEIKVKRIVEDRKEQAMSLLGIILSLKKEDAELEIKDSEAKIKIKKKFPEEVLKKVEAKIKELVQLSKIELTAE